MGWLAISVRDAGPGIAPGGHSLCDAALRRLRSAAMAQEPGMRHRPPLTKSMVELHGGRFEIRRSSVPAPKPCCGSRRRLAHKQRRTRRQAMRHLAMMLMILLPVFAGPAVAEDAGSASSRR